MGLGVPARVLNAGTRSSRSARGQRKVGTVEVGTVVGFRVPRVRQRTVALRRVAEGSRKGGVLNGPALEFALESVMRPPLAGGTVAATHGALVFDAVSNEFIEQHSCGTGATFEVNGLIIHGASSR